MAVSDAAAHHLADAIPLHDWGDALVNIEESRQGLVTGPPLATPIGPFRSRTRASVTPDRLRVGDGLFLGQPSTQVFVAGESLDKRAARSERGDYVVWGLPRTRTSSTISAASDIS